MEKKNTRRWIELVVFITVSLLVLGSVISVLIVATKGHKENKKKDIKADASTVQVVQAEETSAECFNYTPDESEVAAIARVLYAECRGVPSKKEKAAVAWTILNRVDAYGKSVISVVTQPYQFAYSPYYPVWTDLADIARDVLVRYHREKSGETDVGRVLPAGYLYFSGDGKHNHFRNAYRGGTRWDWSLPNPYEN